MPDTDWHYVGEAGEPAFQNSWVNYNGWGDCAFRKMADGMVLLKGLIKSGNTGATIFTLPVGYRPSPSPTGPLSAEDNHIFAVIANAGMGRVDVYADGKVNANGLNNTWVSLNSIRFLAEA